MDAQTARRPISFTTCARCGGRISDPVNFCPQCGAPAKVAFSERRSAAKPVPSPVPKAASASASRADAMFAARSYDDARSAPSSRGGSQNSRVKTGVALAVVALVVLCGVLFALHQHDGADDSEPPIASSTVQGSVTANGTSQPANTTAAAVVPAPTVAPDTPAAQAPAISATPAPASPAIEAPAPTPPRTGDKNQRLLALALARAHTGLDRNDLRMARSGVFWALSLQHDNSEALTLKQELLARERQRKAPNDQ